MDTETLLISHVLFDKSMILFDFYLFLTYRRTVILKNNTYCDTNFKLNFDILTQEDMELDSQDAGNALSLMEMDLMAIDDQLDFYPSMEKK